MAGEVGPKAKKDMMARLAKERRAQGLRRRGYWLSDEDNERVKEFIDQMQKGRQ